MYSSSLETKKVDFDWLNGKLPRTRTLATTTNKYRFEKVVEIAQHSQDVFGFKKRKLSLGVSVAEEKKMKEVVRLGTVKRHVDVLEVCCLPRDLGNWLCKNLKKQKEAELNLHMSNMRLYARWLKRKLRMVGLMASKKVSRFDSKTWGAC